LGTGVSVAEPRPLEKDGARDPRAVSSGEQHWHDKQSLVFVIRNGWPRRRVRVRFAVARRNGGGRGLCGVS